MMDDFHSFIHVTLYWNFYYFIATLYCFRKYVMDICAFFSIINMRNLRMISWQMSDKSPDVLLWWWWCTTFSYATTFSSIFMYKMQSITFLIKDIKYVCQRSSLYVVLSSSITSIIHYVVLFVCYFIFVCCIILNKWREKHGHHS